MSDISVDYSGLSLVATVLTLVFFCAVDTVSAYAIAIFKGGNTFDWEYALDFLRTHILKVAVPIVLLAIVGRGVPEAGIPAIPAVGLFATGSLAVYALSVIASVRQSWGDNAVSPLAATEPVPTAGVA